MEAISIRSINCKKETGFYLGTSTLEEMITKFVLNAIIHHVGMSWIICSNEEIKYEMDKIITPISLIRVIGIAHPYVQGCT